MASFFNAERVQGGWRFFLLWMLMTLLALGVGAAIEFFLFQGQINGNIAILLASITQGWTLNRHISIYIPWAATAVIAWWLSALLIGGGMSIMPMDLPNYLPLVSEGILAGLLAGILHYFFLKEWLPAIGIWWIAIGAVSWISFGIIPAIVLTIIVTRDAVPMENRLFTLTEPIQA